MPSCASIYTLLSWIFAFRVLAGRSPAAQVLCTGGQPFVEPTGLCSSMLLYLALSSLACSTGACLRGHSGLWYAVYLPTHKDIERYVNVGNKGGQEQSTSER